MDADETTLTPEPAAEQPLRLFETLLGVIIRPRRTFERLREAPRGHWWLAAVLALAALVLVTLVTLPIQVEAAQAAMEQSIEQFEFSDEQIAQIEQSQAIFTSQAYLGGIAIAGGAAELFITYLVRTVILFLLGLALGGRASFKQTWRVGVWSTLPDIVRSLVQMVVVLFSRRMPVTGLGAVLGPDASPVLLAALGGIDIYMIWSLALITVGMVAVGRISTAKGLLTAIIYYGLVIGFAVGVTAAGLAIARSFGVGM